MEVATPILNDFELLIPTMAFANKLGSLFKAAVNASNPSVFQAIRCMSSSRLFVGGLSYGTDDASLREAFTSFGEVTEARVITDRDTSRSRGFGFVSFTSTEEASNAISGLDGKSAVQRELLELMNVPGLTSPKTCASHLQPQLSNPLSNPSCPALLNFFRPSFKQLSIAINATRHFYNQGKQPKSIPALNSVLLHLRQPIFNATSSISNNSQQAML
ncbi:uncharacterized protein A4U43_C03F20890 [Asparagus officinalis]|uniref:RRM domain-containing protein n=1 Tax=Asparagus officinalis TaxID=4686 RepID=A0A5P1FBR5_ASPOF|nr:uncharacterized protein A4U43_C03F20890 [Asparagus officinalis]